MRVKPADAGVLQRTNPAACLVGAGGSLKPMALRVFNQHRHAYTGATLKFCKEANHSACKFLSRRQECFTSDCLFTKLISSFLPRIVNF